MESVLAIVDYNQHERSEAMPTLAEIVESLSPQEQEAVRAFIEHLRTGLPANTSAETRSPLVAAAEAFIQQHPELLRRLAQ